MAVSTGEATVTYAGVSIGGSTARQLTEWTRDEHDYINGAFECEFVTTAATDAAFKTELDTIRDAFRKPRQDLTVTQNTGAGAVTILSRKHTDNTGLDTFPEIIKDGDPADTGRSRHFRIRITYQLPADNLSQDFRRIAITGIEYTPSRRRTVTIEGEYTANSSDGATAADTQYFAQADAAELAFVNVVDSTATWERVLRGPITFSETRKTCRFSSVYREVNVVQSEGTTDDEALIDPHMEITVEQMSPGDSTQALLMTGAVLEGPLIDGPGSTVTDTPGGGGIVAGVVARRPILITVTYDANINFGSANALLRPIWISKIRPWMIRYAKNYSPGGSVIIADEQPMSEIYENHVRAQMQFVAYSRGIIRAKISYQDTTETGVSLHPTTSSNPWEYYEFQGPAVRHRIAIEEYEERVGAGDANAYVDSRKGNPGDKPQNAAGFGDNWVLISREPQCDIRATGLDDRVWIANVRIQTVFRYRNKKKPSKANAGGITGGAVATGTG